MNLDELRSEAWLRLLAVACRRLESNGGTMDGTISLAALTDEERRVIIGITGSHRSARADRIRVSLQAIDSFLGTGYGCDLMTALSYLDGRPVRDRRAEHARESSERETALELASACCHSTTTIAGPSREPARRYAGQPRRALGSGTCRSHDRDRQRPDGGTPAAPTAR